MGPLLGSVPDFVKKRSSMIFDFFFKKIFNFIWCVFAVVAFARVVERIISASLGAVVDTLGPVVVVELLQGQGAHPQRRNYQHRASHYSGWCFFLNAGYNGKLWLILIFNRKFWVDFGNFHQMEVSAGA